MTIKDLASELKHHMLAANATKEEIEFLLKILPKVLGKLVKTGNIMWSGFGNFKFSIKPAQKKYVPLVKREVESPEKGVLKISFSKNLQALLDSREPVSIEYFVSEEEATEEVELIPSPGDNSIEASPKFKNHKVNTGAKPVNSKTVVVKSEGKKAKEENRVDLKVNFLDESLPKQSVPDVDLEDI